MVPTADVLEPAAAAEEEEEVEDGAPLDSTDPALPDPLVEAVEGVVGTGVAVEASPPVARPTYLPPFSSGEPRRKLVAPHPSLIGPSRS